MRTGWLEPLFIREKGVSWKVVRARTTFQLTPFSRINKGSNQTVLIHTSPPDEDGTDTEFRNVGF
jgi:hypothetical protein